MKDRGALLGELVAANRAYQAAVEQVDEAARRRLAVSPSDARCLDLLDRSGPMAAGDLARSAGLSPGAITGTIDRLERAGLARRQRDAEDRRRILVEPTPRLRSLTDELYGDLASKGQALLESYSDEELRAVVRFLNDARELNEQHAERLRSAR